MKNMNDNNVIFDQRSDGLNAFFSKIYALMGAGVLVSALVSWIMITFFLDNMTAILQSGSLILPCTLDYSFSDGSITSRVSNEKLKNGTTEFYRLCGIYGILD